MKTVFGHGYDLQASRRRARCGNLNTNDVQIAKALHKANQSGHLEKFIDEQYPTEKCSDLAEFLVNYIACRRSIKRDTEDIGKMFKQMTNTALALLNQCDPPWECEPLTVHVLTAQCGVFLRSSDIIDHSVCSAMHSLKSTSSNTDIGVLWALIPLSSNVITHFHTIQQRLGDQLDVDDSGKHNPGNLHYKGLAHVLGSLNPSTSSPILKPVWRAFRIERIDIEIEHGRWKTFARAGTVLQLGSVAHWCLREGSRFSFTTATGIFGAASNEFSIAFCHDFRVGSLDATVRHKEQIMLKQESKTSNVWSGDYVVTQTGVDSHCPASLEFESRCAIRVIMLEDIAAGSLHAHAH